MIALVRDVSPLLASCELTFLERAAIDVGRACAQHAAYCDALREAGAEVEFMAAAPEMADGVFVEDTAIVLDEVAVITRPGSPSRRAEIMTAASALASLRPLSFIREPGTIDGGDVLRVGRDLFVGITARTNRDGFDQLSALAGRFGYRTTAVGVRGCLHLKTAVTALDDESVVMHEGHVDRRVFERYRVIDADAAEPEGANVVRVSGRVLASASAPRTCERLTRAGHQTIAIDISEMEKAEAGLTCLSLLLPRGARTSRQSLA
ncbi:MAG: arginine deiminase family protein [Acidobacteriota bacterium]|nr:arginine deiminase family protein [Acidobacteriota bacterium]